MTRRLAIYALGLALASAAFADVTGTNVALTGGQSLSLDAGTVGTSGGDLLWNGTTLTPQGSSTAFGYPVTMLGMANYNALTLNDLKALTYSSSPLGPPFTLTQWIIAVHTNAGNYAKIFVVSNAGGSITLDYLTYIAPATTATPAPPSLILVLTGMAVLGLFLIGHRYLARI